MLSALRVAVVGLGKIAHDQHLPAIAADPNFELTAIVSRRGLTSGRVPSFATTEELYAGGPEFDAVSLCTPPEAHYAAARQALLAGKHVLLEKPPTVTVSELAALEILASETGRTLFATWHSRYNTGVARLREFLRNTTVRSLAITWKEDVRRWHPGHGGIGDIGWLFSDSGS